MNGEVLRYKARLTAKGYAQVEGVDYNDTFAPTVKTETLRGVLATAIKNDLDIAQLDVKTAFLIPRLPEDEVIYLEPPPGLNLAPGKVLVLRKAIYGIKQAAHCWHNHLNMIMKKAGLFPSDADPCLYITKEDAAPDSLVAAGVWVDDIV